MADLLETETRANANCITSCITDELRRCDLDIRKCTGFSSDGAAVMVGHRSGVATQLK